MILSVITEYSASSISSSNSTPFEAASYSNFIQDEKNYHKLVKNNHLMERSILKGNKNEEQGKLRIKKEKRQTHLVEVFPSPVSTRDPPPGFYNKEKVLIRMLIQCYL